MKHRTNKFVALTPRQARKKLAARAVKLRDMSYLIADKLNSVGYKAYTGQQTAEIMIESGLCRVSDDLRPVVFFPSHARKVRSNMLASFFVFAQDNPHIEKYIRYGVITNGTHTDISNLGDEISKFSRKISKWASEVANTAGVRVLFRGFEFPIKPDNKVHLHANVMYYLPNRLKKERWSQFLVDTSKHFGGDWWRDNSTVRNIYELLKYPFKPEEIHSSSAATLRDLAIQTFNKRIMQPLGEFREYRNMLKNSRSVAYFNVEKKKYDLREVKESKRIPDPTHDRIGVTVIFSEQKRYSPCNPDGEICATLPGFNEERLYRQFGADAVTAAPEFIVHNRTITVQQGHVRYYSLSKNVVIYLSSLYAKNLSERTMSPP